MKTALATAFALVVITACSKAPTAPTTPPIVQSAGFEGVWTVTFRIDECSGYRHCIDFKGKTETLYVRLARIGDAYEGVVDLGDHVSVTGVVGPDGTLALTGRRNAAQADDFDVEIDPITLSSPTSGGTVRYTVKGAWNPFFFGNAMKQGPIIAIERVGDLESPTSFTGTWTGKFPVRSCEVTGGTYCSPLSNDETYPATLILNPGSSGVEGTLKLGGTTIPVSGTGPGSSVKLSGLGTHQGSGVTTTYVVETDGLVVDRVGRLTGDVTLVATFNWHDDRGVRTVRYPPIPLYATARSLR